MMYARKDNVLIWAPMKSTKTSLLKAGLCLRWAGGCRLIVFMIRGINSSTWTLKIKSMLRNDS